MKFREQRCLTGLWGLFFLLLVAGCQGEASSVRPTVNPMFVPLNEPTATATPKPVVSPKNIVLLLGDGLSKEQIIAAGMYANGNAGTFAFETAPYQAMVMPENAGTTSIGSAALSMSQTTDSEQLKQLLTLHRDQCKRIGFVSNAALPETAGFAPDELTFWQTVYPNVALAGGGGVASEQLAQLGYEVATNREMLDDVNAGNPPYLAGLFSDTAMAFEYDYAYGDNSFYDEYPHLSQMVSTALTNLDAQITAFSC